jgi:hypothetical protein
MNIRALRHNDTSLWDELVAGRGHVLLRNYLDTSDHSLESARAAHVGFCTRLGRLRIQDFRGSRVTVLKQSSGSDDEIPFHTDAGDLLALLCYEGALHGGELDLVNADLLHDDLASMDGDVLSELHKPWEFDRKGRSGPPYFTYPIYYCSLGRPQCFLQMGSLKRRYTQEYNDLRSNILRVLETNYLSDSSRHEVVSLQPGDLLLINNRRILHRRRPYRSFAAGCRAIIRCWVDLYDSPYHEWESLSPLTCDATQQSY